MNLNPRLLDNRYARWVIYGILLILIAEPLHSFVLSKLPNNGFDISDALVPTEHILHGGPPRDGIPALTNPRLIPAKKAVFIQPDDRVLGLDFNGEARAYPIKILNHHEIVNDLVQDKPVVITYCPLCGSGVAFDANVNGRRLEFGVSGLLYNSDVLLYDRQTGSLWSQLMSRSVSGQYKGVSLRILDIENTTWKDWYARHASTLVLTRDTGYRRNYDSNPYRGYDSTEDLYFPVTHFDKRFPAKELVAGLERNGQYRAYAISELMNSPASFQEDFAGTTIRVTFDPAARTMRAKTVEGKTIPVTVSYWFAWAAFHPETTVYYASGKPDSHVRPNKRQ